MQDPGAAVELVLGRARLCRLGLGHGDLLLLGVLLVGAHDLDLLPLPICRYRLGPGLEQMQRLAVLPG